MWATIILVSYFRSILSYFNVLLYDINGENNLQLTYLIFENFRSNIFNNFKYKIYCSITQNVRKYNKRIMPVDLMSKMFLLLYVI